MPDPARSLCRGDFALSTRAGIDEVDAGIKCGVRSGMVRAGQTAPFADGRLQNAARLTILIGEKAGGLRHVTPFERRH